MCKRNDAVSLVNLSFNTTRLLRPLDICDQVSYDLPFTHEESWPQVELGKHRTDDCTQETNVNRVLNCAFCMELLPSWYFLTFCGLLQFRELLN